jgi:outer membrane protein assembly factor BamB
MKQLLVGLGICLVCASAAVAANWPNWRGPDFNGVAGGGGYPTHWSGTENVLWKAELPGKGSSTPIVWNDRIFLTCAIDGKNGVICFDGNGKKIWQETLGSERPGKNKKASGCNPSAVTDGKYVYVYFKSGDLACYDFAGAKVWEHNLQDMYGADTLWWDLGTSPVLTRDFVVVAVIQTGPSYLVAFEKGSGKLAWKQDRNLGAPSEAAQTYATPVVVTEGDRETLIVLGADHVTAHNAADGQELWRVGGLNPDGEQYFRSIASPVVSDGIVIAPYARGKTLTAIKLGGSGEVTRTHVVWTKTGLGADVPTPIAVDGKVYVCTDRGHVACLDVKSGRELWSGDVEKHRTAYSSSPVLAGGKIYITREDGKTFVLEQGNEFKVVGTAQVPDELTVATPVFVDGRILIRTLDNLYCIGK